MEKGETEKQTAIREVKEETNIEVEIPDLNKKYTVHYSPKLGVIKEVVFFIARKIDGEVSPQVLCNFFIPNTPLHDGAVVISENKIAAASCMLPLSNDQDISREYGTRHRAAIGLSSQSDSLVVVVSEETGRISVAKDGFLMTRLSEDELKQILLDNMLVQPEMPKQEEQKTEENPEKKSEDSNNEDNK